MYIIIMGTMTANMFVLELDITINYMLLVDITIIMVNLKLVCIIINSILPNYLHNLHCLFSMIDTILDPLQPNITELFLLL